MASSAQDFRFINTKTSFAFRPSKDRMVDHNKDHPDFMPERGLIHIMPGSAVVEVTAPSRQGHRPWPYTHRYNLYGTHYPPVSDWLWTLLRQVGYGGLIDGEQRRGSERQED